MSGLILINDFFSSILTLVPKSENFIGGYDVNANVGIRKKMYGDFFGQFGLNNSNRKGQNLLGIYLNNNLNIEKTFFNKPSYTT